MDGDNRPLVSVIVPVYNVDKFLKRCLESIKCQTYKNLEIIIVNDGSTDASGRICDEFEDIDKRVKVIHKKNGGLSDARNAGMNYSNGELICFVDGDDYLTLDCIEHLYDIMIRSDADISIGCYYKVLYEDNIPNSNQSFKVYMNRDEALETLLYQKYFTTSAWGKLYKRRVLEGIKFPIDKLHEDVGTIYKVFSKAEGVVYSDKKIYAYVQRDESIISSNFTKKKMDYIEFTKEIVEFFKDDKRLFKAAVSRHFSACFQILVQIPKYEYKNEYKAIVSEIIKYRRIVLRDKKARNKNRAAALISYINIELVLFLLKFKLK